MEESDHGDIYYICGASVGFVGGFHLAGRPSVRHAQVHQLLHGPLQVGGVWEHIKLCLVVHAIPDHHILPAGGDRATYGEQQAAIEGDLQEAQDLASQRTIG